MLRICIVSAGVAAAIAMALLTNSAAAQTATDTEPGKPLALLAGLRPPHEHKAHQNAAGVHASVVSKTSKKTAARKLPAGTKLASKEHRRIAAEPAVEPAAGAAARADDAPATPATNTFASVWPVDSAAASDTASPTASSATTDDGLQMSAVVVDGQTVQVASPDQVNAIDLAADDTTAAKAPAPIDRTGAAPAAARAVFAAAVHKDETASPVGSASWFAQVLAALGGAVAAGTVAWFLIRGGPQRMYG